MSVCISDRPILRLHTNGFNKFWGSFNFETLWGLGVFKNFEISLIFRVIQFCWQLKILDVQFFGG